MAIRIRAGGYRPVEHHPLGVSSIGYHPGREDQELWEVSRGVWQMSVVRAGAERFAVVVAEGVVRLVAEITGVQRADEGRVALEGHVLDAGHPLVRAWCGGPDPAPNGSRNPIGYFTDEHEQAQLRHPCGCGCGEPTTREFLRGHEIRAISARVHDHFDGSYQGFVDWVDRHLAAAATGPAGIARAGSVEPTGGDPDLAAEPSATEPTGPEPTRPGDGARSGGPGAAAGPTVAAGPGGPSRPVVVGSGSGSVVADHQDGGRA